ncbi:MAG: hypothetical protein LBQ46_01125 [Treponema sp.]|jgi:hypothetical protein|nr:hypothetical protein [Treponema sp.]
MEIQRRGDDHLFIEHGYEIARIVGLSGYRDTLTVEGNGVYRLDRTGNGNKHMDLVVMGAYRPFFKMVPGCNYNGNGFGTFCEYEGDRYEGIPWRYAFHRSTIPAMTHSEGVIGGIDWSLSVFSAPNDNNCCSIYEDNGNIIHLVKWPEEESPYTLQHYYYGDPYYATMEMRKEFTAWVIFDKAQPRKQGYRKAFDTAWALNRLNRSMPLNQEEVIKLGTAYAETLYTKENNGFCGFNIGLAWNNETCSWGKRKSNKYEIGWCGQNAMLANALVWEGNRRGDVSLIDKGFSVLDSWIHYAHLPVEVIHSYYDPGQDRYLEACNLGTAGLAFFEAEKLALQSGKAPEPYRQAALEICDFAISHQEHNGCFAKCWKSDGTVAVREGTVGAFLVPPLVMAYMKGHGNRYLQAAENAYAYYYKELTDYGFTTAGALDIYSIDKESGIPLLKGAMMLHKATHDMQWIEKAKYAAWYLCTWQYAYTIRFNPESALTSLQFDTHGGTMVSVVHMGMDPYALSYVPDLISLWEASGEIRWWERAQAIWRNGCQGVSDGTLVVNGRKRPRGSQSEAYQITRQGMMGAAYEWLVAWPTSFRLEGIRRLGGKSYTNAFFSGKTDL